MALLESVQAPEHPAAVTPEPKQVDLLIDTDIHPSFLFERDLEHRMDERWGAHVRHLPPQGGSGFLRNPGNRRGASPGGIPPGSDRGVLQAQVMDLYDVDHAILIPGSGPPVGPPEFQSAYNHAINLSQAEDWVDNDARYRGSIQIPFDAPELAAEEIAFWARDSRFCQVQISENPRDEWGNQHYWPIYEAAEAAGLPLMAHVGKPNQYFGAGYPSYYIEQHIFVQIVIERIATSLIFGGVLDRFPGLQVALIEACIGWAGPLQWAMDTQFERLRADVPTLQARPSEYFREHFWFSTQPIEEPDDPRHLLQAFEMSGMTDRIMFSSDYPHWDFDSPLRTLPVTTPKELREKIMGGNADRLYHLAKVPTLAR